MVGQVAVALAAAALPPRRGCECQHCREMDLDYDQTLNTATWLISIFNVLICQCDHTRIKSEEVRGKGRRKGEG